MNKLRCCFASQLKNKLKEIQSVNLVGFIHIYVSFAVIDIFTEECFCLMYVLSNIQYVQATGVHTSW